MGDASLRFSGSPALRFTFSNSQRSGDSTGIRYRENDALHPRCARLPEGIVVALHLDLPLPVRLVQFFPVGGMQQFILPKPS